MNIKSLGSLLKVLKHGIALYCICKIFIVNATQSCLTRLRSFCFIKRMCWLFFLTPLDLHLFDLIVVSSSLILTLWLTWVLLALVSSSLLLNLNVLIVIYLHPFHSLGRFSHWLIPFLSDWSRAKLEGGQLIIGALINF